MIALRRQNALFGFFVLFAMGFGPEMAQGRQAKTVAQANDPDFAEFVKKATTKPEFLSSLVDHLRQQQDPDAEPSRDVRLPAKDAGDSLRRWAAAATRCCFGTTCQPPPAPSL